MKIVPLPSVDNNDLRHSHIFARIEVNINDHSAICFLLQARGRVLASHLTGLIEHVRRDLALVRAYEHL